MNNIKTYDEFLNEGILSNLFKSVKNYMTGSGKSMSRLVSNFLNKTAKINGDDIKLKDIESPTNNEMYSFNKYFIKDYTTKRIRLKNDVVDILSSIYDNSSVKFGKLLKSYFTDMEIRDNDRDNIKSFFNKFFPYVKEVKGIQVSKFTEILKKLQ